MEGPSEFYKLIQAYIVIAIGVLAVIVLLDSETRRDQENRLALILGHRGCPKALSGKYLSEEAKKLRFDAQQMYAQAKKAAQKGIKYARKSDVKVKVKVPSRRRNPATVSTTRRNPATVSTTRRNPVTVSTTRRNPVTVSTTRRNIASVTDIEGMEGRL